MIKDKSKILRNAMEHWKSTNDYKHIEINEIFALNKV